MTEETVSLPPEQEPDDPEIAFAAMGRKLAGVIAAIDGFAVRQQEIHARDYGQDLALIHQQMEKLQGAIQILAQRPAIALKPADIAAQVEAAGASVRATDHQALVQAQRELHATARSITDIVASARGAGRQRWWIGGAAVLALTIGYMLGMIVPSAIDRAVPEDWHWPEQRAAALLDRNEWDAGTRLLEVADSKRWHDLEETARFMNHNANAVSQCPHDEGKHGKPGHYIVKRRQ